MTYKGEDVLVGDWITFRFYPDGGDGRGQVERVFDEVAHIGAGRGTICVHQDGLVGVDRIDANEPVYKLTDKGRQLLKERESGHPGYLKLLDEMRDLHCKKAADYGRGADPLANVRSAAEFGIPAWVGVMVRANDKVHRIKSFLQNGNLKNESVEDSLMDLAAYSLIALVLYREQAAQSGGRSATQETPQEFNPC